MYGFVTYKYQVSVPYALSVFSGTKLFNRELRLNNRQMNRNNDNNNSNAIASGANNNNNRNSQNRGGQGPMEPRPILPNAPMLPHQFQMQQQQNPFGSAALRGLATGSMNNSMMPPPSMVPRMEFPANPQLDFQTLLQLGSQMMLGVNGLDMNMGNNSADDTGRRHQSKMMHRHENRSHNQNANYSRDKDRRNDRRRDRSRSRSRERQNNDNNWIRNRGGGSGGGGGGSGRDNRKNDRQDRRGSDKNRRR